MFGFKDTLDALKVQSRYRSLVLPRGIDLTSNDYLGLKDHPALQGAAVDFVQQNGALGSGGSRLLRGHMDAHAALEEFAAKYFFAQKTLFFATGFQANYALFTALPDRHSTIIYDELVHASARDGIRASDAKAFKARHNDLSDFEDKLKKAREKTGPIYIAVESVYSMDGDAAPLDGLYALTEKYDAMLIIDEAHGTGVCGPGGKGLSEEIVKAHGYDRIITMHTCGKAIGVAGGLLCASEDVIDYMVNTSRAFIYSTAPMPLQAHLVQQSLELIASEEGTQRRESLKALSAESQDLFGGAGSHIVPIMLGDDARAVHVAEILQQNGYDVRAIRPPTVPAGTARLRLSLSAALDVKTLREFSLVLKGALKQEAA